MVKFKVDYANTKTKTIIFHTLPPIQHLQFTNKVMVYVWRSTKSLMLIRYNQQRTQHSNSLISYGIHAGPRLCPRHPRAGGQPRPRQLGQQPRGGGGQLQPLLGAGVRQVGVYISTYLHLQHSCNREDHINQGLSYYPILSSHFPIVLNAMPKNI